MNKFSRSWSSRGITISGTNQDQIGTFVAIPDAFNARDALLAHPNQITTWKAQLLEGAAGVFGSDVASAPAAPVDLKAFHAKIGQLALENDFLSGALIKAGMLSAKR